MERVVIKTKQREQSRSVNSTVSAPLSPLSGRVSRAYPPFSRPLLRIAESPTFFWWGGSFISSTPLLPARPSSFFFFHHATTFALFLFFFHPFGLQSTRSRHVGIDPTLRPRWLHPSSSSLFSSVNGREKLLKVDSPNSVRSKAVAAISRAIFPPIAPFGDLDLETQRAAISNNDRTAFFAWNFGRVQ